MAQNPLLGKGISLISKKNIRYEGLLYSINEQNATVALQNVRSYGTEGRETDGNPPVGPSDVVHPYLLFRGEDIRDLHVHDETPAPPPPPTQATTPAAAATAPPAVVAQPSTQQPQQQQQQQQQKQQPPPPPQQQVQQAPPKSSEATAKTSTNPSSTVDATSGNKENKGKSEIQQGDKQTTNKNVDTKRPKQSGGAGAGRGSDAAGGGGGRGPASQRNKRRTGDTAAASAVGTGASLLGRKARGLVKDSNVVTGKPDEEFDFQSNLLQLQNEDDEVTKNQTATETGSEPASAPSNAATAASSGPSYNKDSFFDSISCEALDKEKGVDNRLRGSVERQLNTETFGAVALDANNGMNRRRRGGGGTGRSGGYSGGRGGGGRNNRIGGSGRGGGREYGTGRDGGRDSGGGRDGRGRGGRSRGRGRGRGQNQHSDERAPSTQIAAS